MTFLLARLPCLDTLPWAHRVVARHWLPFSISCIAAIRLEHGAIAQNDTRCNPPKGELGTVRRPGGASMVVVEGQLALALGDHIEDPKLHQATLVETGKRHH